MPNAEPIMTHEEYGEIYQRDFCKTVRVVRGRGASLEQAEDVAQRAWFQGWQKLDQLRDKDALVGWVNMIAVNYHRRSGAYEARYHTLSDIESSARLGVNLAAVDVTTILKLCRPADRALFQHQLGGLTTHEIASKQGVTETAIRVRFLRARREVRGSLDARAAALREAYCQEMRATAA
jgi:RNA polymerase sigma-70 factor (ECF subfamily)